MTYRYLVDEQEAQAQAKTMAANLKENTGKSDFVGYACEVLIRRLRGKPYRYREYGMYWPALKQLLNQHGANFGDDCLDDDLSKIYRYDEPASLIAAAEGFVDFYHETWMVGTNEFTIDDEGRNWILFDENMEAMASF